MSSSLAERAAFRPIAQPTPIAASTARPGLVRSTSPRPTLFADGTPGPFGRRLRQQPIHLRQRDQLQCDAGVSVLSEPTSRLHGPLPGAGRLLLMGRDAGESDAAAAGRSPWQEPFLEQRLDHERSRRGRGLHSRNHQPVLELPDHLCEPLPFHEAAPSSADLYLLRIWKEVLSPTRTAEKASRV